MAVPAGSEIQALRKRLGWSQKELAVVLGRDPSWISKCERGVETLSWQDWYLMRAIAGVELKRWPEPPSYNELVAS